MDFARIDKMRPYQVCRTSTCSLATHLLILTKEVLFAGQLKAECRKRGLDAGAVHFQISM